MLRVHKLSIVKDERGSILALFAIVLPLVLVIAAFVIDVGNWFEHKRHLQLQVDAAALAGGGSWAIPCGATTNSNIQTTARDYAGPHTKSDGTVYATAPYNKQIGNVPINQLHVLLNAQNFWTEAPVGTADFSDGGTPCAANYLDVKATDSDVGFLFGAFKPDINAKARVTIEEVDTLSGLSPVAVRSASPKSGAVIFINEADKAILAIKYLTNLAPTAANTWTSAPTSQAEASDITIPASGRVGAVIAFSANGQCPSPPPGTAPCFSINTATYPTVDAICNQGGVECYDAPQDASGVQTVRGGLVFVRGYNSTATSTATTPPVVKDVYLDAGTAPTKSGTPLAGGCGDAYYNYILDTSCNVVISAAVDIGGRAAGSVSIRAKALNLAGQDQCPNGNGAGNPCILALTSGRWLSGGIEVPGSAGPFRFELTWEVTSGSVTGLGTCSNGAGNPCKGTFGVVQRTFSGDDDLSGPIRDAKIWNADASYPGFYGTTANSYALNSTHKLYVVVRVAGAIATADTDPPIALRVTGSQNGSVDCDPAVANFVDEFSQGCEPSYEAWPPNSNPVCPAYNVLWTLDQPWNCVKTQTGGAVGNLNKALRKRLFGSEQATQCPGPDSATSFVPGRNYWKTTNNLYPGNAEFPHYSQNDPRLVTLFMVPFSSFLDQGNGIFPVIGFGSFYITGWGDQDDNGVKQKDPCPGADSAPKGFIVGHFVKQLVQSPIGTGSGVVCDPTSPTPCVAVLTE